MTIVRLRNQRIEALLQKARIILRRNDDAHQRIVQRTIVDPVLEHLRNPLHLCGEPTSLERRLLCLQRRFLHVVLRLRVQCRRTLALTPMVEHLRNMRDLVGLLRNPHGEVVVLAAVVLGSQPLKLLHQTRAIHSQMRCIHVRHQSVRRPVRLKERRMPNGAVIIYLILVTVNEIEVYILIKLLHNFVERKWRQRVVAVHKCNELALCRVNTCVRAGRDSAILLAVDDLDVVALSAVLLQRLRNTRHVRRVVHEDQLPVAVVLGAHRLDGRHQILVWHVVDRHHH